MKQCKQYVASLQKKSERIPEIELRKIASTIDGDIAELLYKSFRENKSYDAIEMTENLKGNVLPTSRNTFYRKRRRYIKTIEQHLAATAASV
nr:MAG TPA: hypothetical protein [Caudoviricetes sp.]